MDNQWWYCDGCTLYFESFKPQGVCPECGEAGLLGTCDCGGEAIDVIYEADTGATMAVCDAYPQCCKASVEWTPYGLGALGMPTL